MGSTSKELPRPKTANSSGPEAERIFQNESGARLIAKITRELLQQATFKDAGELREAIESRCAALGLSCRRDQVERALDLIGSNTILLDGDQKAARHESEPAPPPVTHAEAQRLLAKCGVDVSGGRMQPASTRRQSRLTAL